MAPKSSPEATARAQRPGDAEAVAAEFTGPPDLDAGPLDDRTDAAPTYLEQLTPSRAFGLFFALLLAGIGLIFSSDFVGGAPWFALLAPAIYGATLFAAQRRYHVALNGTVKDSPYFLGFILTMAAVGKIFVDIARRPPGSTGSSQVIVEAGAAIVTTVVGLFFRQLLLSFDRAENLQDLVFQSAIRNLREGAVKLHNSQAEFLGLAQEFVTARKRLFSREETALSRYVEKLEAGTAVLQRIEEGYPQRIDKLLSSLDGVASRVERSTNEELARFRGLHSELHSALQREIESASRDLRASAQALVSAREQATAQMNETVVALGGSLKRLNDCTSQIGEQSSEYSSAATGLTTVLTGLAKAIAETDHQMTLIRQESHELSKALRVGTTEISAHTEGLRSTASARARALEQELQAIDAVVTEFTDLMSERIRASS